MFCCVYEYEFAQQTNKADDVHTEQKALQGKFACRKRIGTVMNFSEDKGGAQTKSNNVLYLYLSRVFPPLHETRTNS